MITGIIRVLFDHDAFDHGQDQDQENAEDQDYDHAHDTDADVDVDAHAELTMTMIMTSQLHKSNGPLTNQVSKYYRADDVTRGDGQHQHSSELAYFMLR